MLALVENCILRPLRLALDPEDRVMIFTLPRQNLVIVKSRRFLLEMPFSDHGGQVARLAHQGGQVLPCGGNPPPERQHPVGLAVLSGDDRGPARCTDGVIAEAVFKKHPLLRQPVDHRGRVELRQPGSVDPEGLRGVIVAHDEKNVGTLRRSRHRKIRARKNKRQ